MATEEKFRFSVQTNRADLIRWREWGPEAFQEAQEQNKLPVLFLTAFWCGFCQRMDEGALSEDDVITLLNAFFIPIRVEESQRPDVDLRYNQNGWPTIAFITPDGGHLLSVNYTDPEPFANLLVKLVDLRNRDEESLFESAAKASQEVPSESPGPLGPAVVAEIAGMVEGLADPINGGFGGDFKFLHTEALEFLLYLCETAGFDTESNDAQLTHARLTLDNLRRSKMYDSEDGGFFRYSSKADWGEPHPEKLLDDQAALLQVYLHTYLLTGHAEYRETAEALVDYINTTLSSKEPVGVYLGCQDYVRQEGQLSLGQVPEGSSLVPVFDEYIYCDANARTASAFLDAWWILGIEDCKHRAVAVLEFLWESMRAPSGGMFHYWNGQGQAPGLLADAVAAGSAFLKAYASLGDQKYLDRAQSLAEDIVRMHRNSQRGFNDTSQTGPAHLKFPLTVLSQNAEVAAFFLRLADLAGQTAHREEAFWALQSFPNAHREHGAFAAGFGQALARLLAGSVTVTVSGEPGDPGVRALAQAASTRLGHGNLLLRFREDHSQERPFAEVRFAGRPPVFVDNVGEFSSVLGKTLGLP